VEVVVAEASGQADHIPRINMLEVRPDRVRLVGLAFEEYVIQGIDGRDPMGSSVSD
jgi:hypothetical protein